MGKSGKKMNGLVAFLLFLVSLPFIIGGLVIFGLIYVVTVVLPAPVEYIIYKNSQFYKDLKIKYFMGVTSNFGYKSYKYVKGNPSLEFVCQEEGYYYYKSEGAILVMPYYAEYKRHGNSWLLTMKEGGDTVDVHDVKPTFQNLIKENLNELEIKLLVKDKYFKKEELLDAKSDPVFVFYKNHKDFISIEA